MNNHKVIIIHISLHDRKLIKVNFFRSLFDNFYQTKALYELAFEMN